MADPEPNPPPIDITGATAGTVLQAMIHAYGDLQHAMEAERAEVGREEARIAHGAGPGEVKELELQIARRLATIQFMGKAIFDGYGSTPETPG